MPIPSCLLPIPFFMIMKIAIAQINPIIGDLLGNTQKILEMSQQAASENVRLLLTPELSICGYPPRDLLLNPSFVESIDKTLQKLRITTKKIEII